VIGKAYSGLTDVEIAEMTAWFEAHRLPAPEARAAYEHLGLKRGEILVEPAIVVEIAFDIIQRSRLHAGGLCAALPADRAAAAGQAPRRRGQPRSRRGDLRQDAGSGGDRDRLGRVPACFDGSGAGEATSQRTVRRAQGTEP